MTKPTYLVCPPTHYEVSYVINPWMQPTVWAAERAAWTAKARAQWETLIETMQGLQWGIKEIAGQPGLPDMVFAANHAFVMDKKAVVMRACTKERDGETPHILKWFGDNGFEAIESRFVFEGGGDALYDPHYDLIWLGYGFRSSALMKDELERIYGKRVIPLALKNAYYYHLDTCLCPLRNGWAMLTASAFTRDAMDAIKSVYGDNVVYVEDADARQFACNAVVNDKDIVMPVVGEGLKTQLNKIGFTTHNLELDSYILAGGASRCLTLRLTD